MSGVRRSWRRPWRRPVAAAGWGESTFAEQAWGRSRGAGRRWALGGAALGALGAVVLFAPAAWLAQAVADATGQRLVLADARGTVWSGSAVVVLTGGPGSRDAASLPGRLDWTLGLRGLAFELRARQACCLNGTVALQVQPGLGRLTTRLVAAPGWTGQWPSAWLGGLGVPFNTLQLGGIVRLVSPGLEVESVQGRWRINGSADVQLDRIASRLSTLDTLGSYSLRLNGDPSAGGAQLQLSTREGALQLSGNGSWSTAGLRFRGEARADSDADAPALANLLNIIGRRQGARSVISIG